MADDVLDKTLCAGLAAFGQSMPRDAARTLGEFLRLLDKWNQTWNLTAVRDPLAMVPRHVLDSLSIRPWLAGSRVVDVGSGAGLPGIPLAIAEPAREFVLIDSAAKRTRFMTQAAAVLGLGNVRVVRIRAEDYRPDSGFDTVISRAFASLAGFVNAAGHLCGKEGQLLAMKGQFPEDEIAGLPESWQVSASHALTVPGLAAQRHLVVLKQAPGKKGG